MPPLPMSQGEQRFTQVVGEKLGLRNLPVAQARNSGTPYDDRPACCANNNCVPVCPVGAKYDAAAALMLGTSAALAQAPSDDLIERGRYLATASDCVACHTGSDGLPFAGNHVIGSPVGDIVATNITPSVTYGIGSYTLDQFSDAVRRWRQPLSGDALSGLRQALG